MGYFHPNALPPAEPPAVTVREFMDALGWALGAIAAEALDRRYRRAVEDLARGCPRRAVARLRVHLGEYPHDPALHRRLGLSYLCAGNARRAAHHLEAALLLLDRAAAAAPPLAVSLRLQVEAAVVRLGLVAVYERLGHRAGMIRCLLQDPASPGTLRPRSEC